MWRSFPVVRAVHFPGVRGLSLSPDFGLKPIARSWASSQAPAAGDAGTTKKPVMVTTPIFYVNGSPHIGHLYSALVADAVARWHRMQGASTLFLTGTDEHGLKIQEAAKAKGKTPVQFCDEVSKEFRDLMKRANISNDQFIPTTEERHSRAVHALWKRLEDRGYIYKGKYEGWYCVSDEAFLTPLQITDGLDKQGNPCKVSLESGHPVEWIVEENFKFRLSAFQKPLLQWLESSDAILPRVRANELFAFLKEKDLQDLSVSRIRSRISWGIPVPNDEEHTIYVWLDALTNYLSATGFPWEGSPTSDSDLRFAWPADYHIIGKDIARFHSIYWIAFLMAAELPLPKRVVAHAHWTVNRLKMSKSLGNVITPNEIIDKYGLDPVRYFLLREGGMVNDGDFSHEMLSSKLNNDLADTLGNFFSRLTAPSLNPTSLVPECGELTNEDRVFIDRMNRLPEQVGEHYKNVELSQGISALMNFLYESNKYIQDNEPWKVRKTDKRRCETVLHVAMEAGRLSGLLLQPIIPDSASRMLDMLGVPEDQRNSNALTYGREPGAKLSKGILFTKVS